ncbi:DNA damage-repair/toleration protein [Cardamine amara subsp. amara]|uniref:DNA damage-repair/toleration protein n=1 Tax=Cardamine amara subsp. amara TaxID=228776 RepID=A0ABD1BYB0_CARAN
MNSCSFPFFTFAAVIFLRCLSSTEAAVCHPDDEAGLLAFKSGITGDPSGILSSWKKGTDCCSWNGITCLPGGRVTRLVVEGSSVIAGSFLSGTISPSLAKLQHLQDIRFTNLEKITGSFPQFLFQLPKLKDVYIQNNRLSGPLPANIGALSQLELFIIDGNQFSGPIPHSISNLTRLFQLNLGRNRFSGAIPDIFKSMTQLQYLELPNNKLSGKLPPSLASLAPTLRWLDLGKNHLSGTIPDYLFRFKELFTLHLSTNQFSGVVPKSSTRLTNLNDLDLSHNLLTGPFPDLKVKDIRIVDLSYNQFQLKTIPKWVTSSQLLYSLKLAKCGIIMRLDDWKAVSTFGYSYIDLSENEITGSPEKLLNQANQLLVFKASGNKLRFDMGQLNFNNSLSTLDLSRNFVFGKVTATVATLEELNLSHNHLCGKLPATKFQANAFTGNDCLCGSPLSPCKA